MCFWCDIFWLTGNFGVGIASFFVFARLVIAVNIFVAVLWACFVIVPAVIKYDTSDIVTVMYHDDEDDDIFYLTNLFDGRVCLQSWSCMVGRCLTWSDCFFLFNLDIWMRGRPGYLKQLAQNLLCCLSNRSFNVSMLPQIWGF